MRPVVFVTGASRPGSIGDGICRRLAADGWDVAFGFWDDYDAAMPWGEGVHEELADDLRALGARALPVAVDLAHTQSPGEAIARVHAGLGPVRALVASHAHSIDSGILDTFARHPSQLYQATLEGLVMFCVLAWYSRRPRPRYAVSGLFALMYGCFRFLVEFVREPDAQLGYLAFGWLTMGQVLSVPLILLGLFWCWKSHSSPTLQPAQADATK